jgi:hypothetical protein
MRGLWFKVVGFFSLMTPVKNLSLIQSLARKHLGKGEMDSSARPCLADSIKSSAKVEMSDEDWQLAAKWAIRSLAYSVGILHADYKRAFKAAGIEGEVRLVS